MSNIISSTPVPYEGPEEYDMLFVGEAPGGEEVGQGRPFIGKSGQLLERYLGRCRILRNQVMLANLCKYRPRGNKFRYLLKTTELERGLEDLKAEIARAKPNVIVALGGWPMYFLTGVSGRRQNTPVPGSGIGLYRGSRLPALEDFGGGKVFCTYHPSYIERDWKSNPIFFLDLQHAVEDSKFPELAYTEYEEHIDPPADVLSALTEESIAARWTSVDIETFPDGRFSCIGWAFKREDGSYVGVCVTYKREDLWGHAQRMWQAPSPKIFQYGTYDISFMQYFWQWHIGGYYGGVGWDTYVAAANLLPDFPRGLDFQCSIHTRFPYYKTERKVWREKGDMNILWRYNIKDCVATHEIAEVQMREIGRLYA